MTDQESGQTSGQISGRCPLCGKPTQRAFRPFCSRRCADLDLARWIGGNYRIAGQQAYDADGDPSPGDGHDGADRTP